MRREDQFRVCATLGAADQNWIRKVVCVQHGARTHTKTIAYDEMNDEKNSGIAGRISRSIIAVSVRLNTTRSYNRHIRA